MATKRWFYRPSAIMLSLLRVIAIVFSLIRVIAPSHIDIASLRLEVKRRYLFTHVQYVTGEFIIDLAQ